MRNRIHIRMEDLTDESYSKDAKVRQRHAVIEPIENHCVEVEDNFEPIMTKTKWKHFHAKEKEYDFEQEKRKLLRYYSKKELRFVLSQLDMDFEKKLGYNYDYVYEMLESNDVPESPYLLSDAQKRLNHIIFDNRQTQLPPLMRPESNYLEETEVVHFKEENDASALKRLIDHLE